MRGPCRIVNPRKTLVCGKLSRRISASLRNEAVSTSGLAKSDRYLIAARARQRSETRQACYSGPIVYYVNAKQE